MLRTFALVLTMMTAFASASLAQPPPPDCGARLDGAGQPLKFASPLAEEDRIALMVYVLAPWAVEALKIVLGPLSGALAGALAAQGIARRNATIQRQLDELRATNAAVSAARATVAAAASLKQQHVKSMKEAYDQANGARDAAQVLGQQFQFTADLQTLPPFRTAIPMPEKLLYERISPPAGVLGLFAVVVQSVGGVSDAIEARTTIVRAIKSRSPVAADELAQIYFGLLTADGHADLNFPQTLEALVHNVDCTILYGCALAQGLAKHAARLSSERKDFPPGEKADFSALTREGLIPSITDDDQRAFEALGIIPNIPNAA